MYVSRRILIGNISRFIPPEERLHPDLTHAWTVYVKEENRGFINSVTFKLHESFINNVVEKTFPFEVSESGWGEFNVTIKIHTKKGTISTSHFLKLHDTEKSERKDEIIFLGSPEEGDNCLPSEEEALEYSSIKETINYVIQRLDQK